MMASAAAFIKQGVAVTLVGAQHVAQLLGHGDGDVEVASRQHLGLARFEPALGLVGYGIWDSSGSCRNGRRRPRRCTDRSARGVRRAPRCGRPGCRRWRADAMAASTRHAPTGSSSAKRRKTSATSITADRPRQRPVINPVEELERGAGRLGQVRVDGGRGDVGVPEQDLDDPGVDAAFEQPRRIAVAQACGVIRRVIPAARAASLEGVASTC